MRRQAATWLGALLIAAIVAAASFDIYRGYHDAVRDTGRELDTQARMIAEQTARSIQAVDVVLRHVKQQAEQAGLLARSPQAIQAFLREQAAGLVQIDGLALVMADGEVRATSRTATPRLNIADNPAFRSARAASGSPFVVETVQRGNSDGQQVVPMGRRIVSADGAFRALIVARGRIDYFQEFYRDVKLEAGNHVTLMHTNGTLVARYPPAPDSLGNHYPQFEKLIAEGGGTRPPRAKSPIDGGDRFGALQRVPDYPLVVVVARDAEVALAAWRSRSLGTGLRTLALAAIAAALLALLQRQLSRLRTTQERFALAVAGSDDGIWDYDFVNQRVTASARAREISLMPPGPETMSVEEWLSAVPIHPEDAPKRLAAMEDHLAGRTPAYVGEYRMMRPDGSYRWVRVHGLCIRDAAGKPLRLAGSTSDIDARKRAEEALRTSEEQYRAIFNSTTDALILRDAQGLIVDVNRAWLERNGLTREEVMADRARIYAPTERQPKIREMIRRALAGESINYQLQVERKQGEIADLDVHLMPVLYRGQAHALSVARDITAQKHAEEALRASEEQYRAIFNASTDALVLRDANTRIVDVNPAFLRISGYSREEVIGGTRWVFAVPEMLPLAGEMHRRVMAGETVRFEMKAQRKDGTLIDVEMHAAPVLHRGSTHALGMARDITAQKQAEAERVRLEGQLLQAKKLEAIGTLAGGIAHDFNNILSAILGYGEMAQKSAAEGTPLRRHLDAVVSAGQRAKSLVARILAFSRSGVGERVPVHAQAVVAEALDLAAASLPAGVRLERRLEAGDAAVLGDPTQIHQVVMNLCANAAQAMKGAGTLTVSLDIVAKDRSMAATSVLLSGHYVRLRVTDTGSGIPAHLLERIFDPFFTTKEVGVGTGLGLSLVHGIVTDLGGGIDVESKPDLGTTFTVYLPWSRSSVPVKATVQAVPEGGGETVLLVDDEEALVRLGEEMIASLGYEPVGFTSSSAALAAFRAEPARFQAVLSDESMPEMTGSELAREIRRLRPDIPIVLMSGFVSPALAARARELGIAEVLAKPLVSGDIARSLAAALHS